MTMLSRRFVFVSPPGSFFNLSPLCSFLLFFSISRSEVSLSSASPLSFSVASSPTSFSSSPSVSFKKIGRSFSKSQSEDSPFSLVSLYGIHSRLPPVTSLDTFKAKEEAKGSSSFQRDSDSLPPLSSACFLQASHKPFLHGMPYFLSPRNGRKNRKPLFLFSSSSFRSPTSSPKRSLSYSSPTLFPCFFPCEPSTNQPKVFQRGLREEDSPFFFSSSCSSPSSPSSRLHQHHSGGDVSLSLHLCLHSAVEEGKKKKNLTNIPSSSSFSPVSPFSLDLHLLVCERGFGGSSSSSFGNSLSCLYATKKGGGSSKNGRDSNPKFLGVKKFGGEFVLPGHILVRQRGSRYKAGDGVKLCRDDSLTAVRSGFVDFNPVYKFEFHYKKRRWLQRHRRRIHAGYLVSVLDRKEDSPGYQKREKLALIRTLSSAWVSGEVSSSLKGSYSSSSFFPEKDEENGVMASPLSGEEQEERRKEDLRKV